MSGRWDLYAEPGECVYCGKRDQVKPEPFGSQDACQECWEQICYGDERDEPVITPPEQNPNYQAGGGS